ncbi:MAG: GNAT family N-acetyltransferase [Blastocatellia bacterium]
MKPGVIVRLATKEDAKAISEVLYDAFSVFESNYTPKAFEIVTPKPEEIARRFDEGPQWVAVKSDEVVGTVSLATEPEGHYIRSMAVRPGAQGLGIGHKLLDALDDHVADSDIERIFLYTTYFVPGAKELYEKHGFKWVRDTTAEEWHGTPGLEMDKKLKEERESAKR